MCIDLCYISVVHPRCSGQVEHANGMILQGLKEHIFNTLEKYDRK